jgi:3-oxoacyl-[acyl-carrier protein] reductase
MDFGLAGRVALVTGGSKGIGLACSHELAAEGAKVMIASRSQDNVDAAVAEVAAKSGGTIAGVAADCMTPEGIAAAIAAAQAAFGPVTIAIFIPNASIPGDFADIDDEAFLLADNNLVLSFARLARGVIPDMKAAKFGRIVTIGSMCARMVHRHIRRAVANTYRLAGIGLSKQLSDEFGRDGITVNTIGTGSILTPAFLETFGGVAAKEGKSFAEIEAEKAADIPVGRLGRPEEMAAAAVFLCSQRASFITGQTLLVDGGRVPSPL